MPTCRCACSPSSGWHSCSSWRAWRSTLPATSLGLVVPVQKDAGQSATPTGQAVVVAASVADVAAVLLLSLFFSTQPGTGGGTRVVLLVGFALFVVVLAWALLRAGRSPRLGDALLRQQDTTGEVWVRACVALLLGLVAVASRFGLETILGAFVAGAVLAFVDRDAMSHPRLRAKLGAVGYGFVVPVFFVASGLQLDVRGLLGDPAALARVPVFLVALLVVRVPLRCRCCRRLVAAGLLSVLLLPAAALVLLRGGGSAPTVVGVPAAGAGPAATDDDELRLTRGRAGSGDVVDP